MLKLLILISTLCVSNLTFAQDDPVVTDAEIAECAGTNKFKKDLCKIEISMHKKLYQRYLDEGLPEVKDIAKEDIKECSKGDSNKEYHCKIKLIKQVMSDNRKIKAQGRIINFSKPSVKALVPLRCPYEGSVKCKYFNYLISTCPKDSKLTDCVKVARKEIDDNGLSSGEEELFVEYTSCLENFPKSSASQKEFCMIRAKDKIDAKNGVVDTSNCDLTGQTQGYCNGFLYKRKDSIITDISRKFSNSPYINEKKLGQDEDNNSVSSSSSLDQ